MSVTASTERAIGGGRLAYALADGWVLTKRNLLTYLRKPDLLVFSTIQPVMFVLLFVFVFGGAIKGALPRDVPYVDFLMPGIFVQTAIFSALQTGVGLAEDLQVMSEGMRSGVNCTRWNAGTSVLDLKTNDFEFRPGPLFTQVLLADEINRATPKTQAALLEAMQERQVTVDGETHPLASPFFVLATQNPVELEGTFPLPEAQLDRFLLRVRLGYPSEREEELILLSTPAERVLPTTPLPNLPSLDELRGDVATVALEHPVRRYVIELARATREHPELAVGASPRAVEQMGDAARAFALIDGRDYVLPDDVKALAEPVFGHRLVPTTDARIRDRDAEQILREILRTVPVPTEA